MSYSFASYFLELLASITGFAYWKNIKDTYWKWFPVYLLVIVISELIGVYLSHGLKNSDLNGILYNYFVIPLEFLFFIWLFAKYFESPNERRWAIGGAIIYSVSWIIEILFPKKKAVWFMSLSFTIGNIVLLILVILFFIRLVNSEKILHFKRSMMFWVALGVLIFPLTFPFYALRNTLYIDYRAIILLGDGMSARDYFTLCTCFSLLLLYGRNRNNDISFTGIRDRPDIHYRIRFIHYPISKTKTCI